jgi:hypothetical protein
LTGTNEALKRELKIREIEDISLIFPLMDEMRETVD